MSGFLQVGGIVYDSFQDYYDSQESRREYAREWLRKKEEQKQRETERLRRLGILE